MHAQHSLASYGRNCPILRHTLQPARQKCSGVDKSMPYLNHTEWGGIKRSQAQAPTPWGKPSQRSKVVQGCFHKEEPGGACRQQTRMHSHAKHQLASEGCKQKTAYEMLRSLVGSEMCIRDRIFTGAQNGQCTLSTLLHHTVGIVPLYGMRCSLHVRNALRSINPCRTRITRSGFG